MHDRIFADQQKITPDDLVADAKELGAVELRRAAVERREEAATGRETALERIATDLARREHRIGEEKERAGGDLVALPVAPEDAAGARFDGNVLFFSGAGYGMLDRPGRAVPEGAVLEIEGSDYVVVRVGRSPLPGDRRMWAYLEARRTQTSV